MIVHEARRRVVVAALVSAAGFAAIEAFLWGFTVDDALITARVATHLANGLGHRFNSDGPVVDAVTPLGFAHLLSLFAHFAGGDPWRTMYFAKWFGAACGLGAAALVGGAVALASGDKVRFAALLPFVCSAPLAAWCVSGMETGLVVLLATVAVVSSGPRSAAAAGVAAALRPELVPWSATLALFASLAEGSGSRRASAFALAWALGPAIGVALVRLVVFGHPAPLAVWAKPSDAAHGAWYAAACLIWTGAPVLVIATRSLGSIDGKSRAVLVASLAHVAALVLAGGDWMALFRLFVPVLPGLVVVGARIAGVAPRLWTAARVGVATGVSLLLLFDKGPEARHIGEQRAALIDDARALLAGSHAVASLDVGWVGTAFPGRVVDLAGVTDETVARLPGGHTSKRVPPSMLEHRGVDTLVFLTEGPKGEDAASLRYSRAVEARLVQQMELVPRAFIELRGTSQRYVVLRVRNGS